MEKTDKKIHYIDIWVDTKVLGHPMLGGGPGGLNVTDKWLPHLYPKCYFSASWIQDPGQPRRRHTEGNEILYRAYGRADDLYEMYFDLDGRNAIGREYNDGLTLRDEFHRRLDRPEPDTFHKRLLPIVHFGRLHG